jgi:trimeric autotransporter adhesin
MKFLSNINLRGNQIQNAVLHKFATEAELALITGVAGQVAFVTGTGKVYVHTGLSWEIISGDLSDVITSTDAVTISIDAEGVVSINIANATAEMNGLMSAADKVKLDGLASDLEDAIEAAKAYTDSEIAALNTEIRTDLATEVSNINTRIDGEVASLESAIESVESELSNEVARAIEAEGDLQTAISVEIINRIDGDNTLQGNINGVASNLATEVTRATTAEQGITASLNAEIARATSAEGTITSNLASEVTRATEAEAVLRADLATEVLDRIAGDAATLASAQSYTNAEILALIDGASSGYDTLKKLEDKISFIISNVDPAALDSLTEIVEALQNLEGEATDALNALAVELRGAINTEIARAEAAEASLQSAIGGEIAARISGDAALQTAIAAEETRALAAEGVLNTKIEGEIARATEAEAVLRGDLSAEITRASLAELALSQDLAAEEASRIAGDAALQASVDTINSELSVIDQTLAGAGLVANNGKIDVVPGAGMEIKDGAVAQKVTVATIVGNGSTVNFPINHNWGTKNVVSTVVEVSTGETVFVESVRTNNNTMTFKFGFAPAIGEDYTVMISSVA